MIQLTPQAALTELSLKSETDRSTPVLPSTDELLCTHIRRALNESGQIQLRSVAVSASNGSILLEGRVSSYYLKQLAQTHVLTLNGVKSLENDLLVA